MTHLRKTQSARRCLPAVLLPLVIASATASPLDAQCRHAQDIFYGTVTPEAGDHFGEAVALCDSYTIVAAPDRNGGSIYFYPAGSTFFDGEYEAFPALNGLGTSLAVNDDASVVVAGAPHNGPDTGLVYVFAREFGHWIFKTGGGPESGHQTGAQYGAAVAADGNVMGGGAPFYDYDATDSGLVSLWRLTVGWGPDGELSASDAQPFDYFGSSLSISGAVAVVGAPGVDTADGDDAGAVYVFRHDGADWIEEQKLTASTGGEQALFGTSVSVHGDRILIGAPGHQNNGRAYVFAFDGVAWNEEAVLDPLPLQAGSDVGRSVSLDGPIAAVGAPLAEGGDGAVFQYRWNGTGWVKQQTLVASVSSESLGASVAVAGNRVVAGSPDRDFVAPDAGSAYGFHVPPLSTCFAPTEVSLGQDVRWLTTGGVAEEPFLLVITSFDDLPLTMPVLFDQLDDQGMFRIDVPFTEPTLVGYEAEAVAYSFDLDGKIVMSNTTLISLQ